MAEGDSFAGRVRRYARVAPAMGGLAARLAGERYLGIGVDREKHAGELRAALGGIKGPLVKVAQLLATIPDALPAEYAGELAQLQANAPPMGWPFVKRRMSGELGPAWQGLYGGFEREAAHAASLGQVHRATAHDGTRLAVKLQYPEMASAVEADLNQLRVIFAIYERYDRAVTMSDIHAEVGARLREELDYVREAKHMRLYRRILADEPGIRVPALVPALSTARLLTMTWLDGGPLLAFAEAADQETRNELARLLFRAWYVPFYRYGVIHGDPHLGNYAVWPQAQGLGINLLDFGCVRVFPARFVKGVIDLYHALEQGDRALAVAAYESWGFRGLTDDLVEVLNRWARFIYDPLLDDRVRRIQTQTSGDYGREVAESVHRDLKRTGGVRPPREFVFMDRAAIGLGSVFLRLKAELNWRSLFIDLVHDFEEAALAARQAEALAASDLPLPA